MYCMWWIHTASNLPNKIDSFCWGQKSLFTLLSSESLYFFSAINTSPECHKIISIRSKFYGSTCLFGRVVFFYILSATRDNYSHLSTFQHHFKLVLHFAIVCISYTGRDNIEYYFLCRFFVLCTSTPTKRT